MFDVYMKEFPDEIRLLIDNYMHPIGAPQGMNIYGCSEENSDIVGTNRTICNGDLWTWIYMVNGANPVRYIGNTNPVRYIDNTNILLYKYINVPNGKLEYICSTPSFQMDSINFCTELITRVDYAKACGLFNIHHFGGQGIIDNLPFVWNYAKNYLRQFNIIITPVNDPSIKIHRDFTVALYHLNFHKIRELIRLYDTRVKILHGYWFTVPFNSHWQGIIDDFYVKKLNAEDFIFLLDIITKDRIINIDTPKNTFQHDYRAYLKQAKIWNRLDIVQLLKEKCNVSFTKQLLKHSD